MNDIASAIARYNNSLAIIVPYRNRQQHLRQFVPHIIRYFERDKLDCVIRYTVHIVEQADDRPFNAGVLRNAGAVLAENGSDYFCFNDVDYLPIWADYSFPEQPVRLIQYGLYRSQHDYPRFFGAVIMMSKRDFYQVNGYSNGYWDWGYEDEELRERCRIRGLQIGLRPGTFQPLPHKSLGHDEDGRSNSASLKNRSRYQSRLSDLASIMETDGLSSMRIKVVDSRNLVIDTVKHENVFHHRVEIVE